MVETKNVKGYKIEGIGIDKVLFQKLSMKAGGELKPSSMDFSLNITNFIKMDDRSANLGFRYLVKYMNIGYIDISGKAVISNIPATQLQNAWEKKKSHALFNDILNALYYFVSPVAINLSTSLGLPPALFPLIMPQQKTKTTRKAKA